MSLLRGKKADYSDVQPLRVRAGAFGRPCVAKVDRLVDPSECRMHVGDRVLVKFPRLPVGLSYEEKNRWVEKLSGSLAREFPCLERLNRVGCVAHVLDFGAQCVNGSRRIPIPSIFLVQELIDGVTLDEYCIDQFGRQHSFTGIPDAKIYYKIARELSAGAVQIHREQVIHGDIWPRNIMIDRANRVRFIDFGQGVLRDHALARDGQSIGKHPYLAPEGSGSVASDIYALGGTMFYLATGHEPPGSIENDDALKSAIVAALKLYNPELYLQSRGVADVIARCMRHDHYSRNRSADDILEDINMYDGPAPARISMEALGRQISKLDRVNPLFTQMARRHFSELGHEIESMLHGVYDLTGDHEQIVTDFTRFVSFLRPGDSYSSITTPHFWQPENIGIDGRFLSMNIDAAQHGAVIRRVFLITDEDRCRLHFSDIIKAQVKAISELAGHGVNVLNPSVTAGGYYIGYQILSEEQRDSLMAQGKHAGLLLQQGRGTLAVATYNKDSRIVAIRFRKAGDLILTQQRYFRSMLAASRSLLEYKL